MKTFDLTPSWQGLAAALITVIVRGESAEARKDAVDAILNMAKAADKAKELSEQLAQAREELSDPDRIPEVFLRVEGGLVQGWSSTLPVYINIYDADCDEDERGWTEEGWQEMCNQCKYHY